MVQIRNCSSIRRDNDIQTYKEIVEFTNNTGNPQYCVKKINAILWVDLLCIFFYNSCMRISNSFLLGLDIRHTIPSDNN